MKIVLLGTANPFRSGGIATFNENLALEIQNQGHDICIYNFKLQYPQFLFPGKSQYRDEPMEDKVLNFQKVNSINPFNWIKNGIELYRMKPDFIIFRYWISFMVPCFSIIAWIAKFNGHTKILTIIDNAISHEAKIFDKILPRIFFHISDKFIAMSSKVKADFATLSNKNIQILPHPMYYNYGAMLDRTNSLARLNLDSQFQYILFFGFIREYKGLDLLIEAMSDERIQSKKIKLLIAGEFYTDKSTYINQIKALKLEEEIIVHSDFIPDDLVSAYFCASDAVILPYKAATQSGVTQIAYYYHTPIIATKVGGIEEFVKDGIVGIMTEPNSQSIANSINRLYDEKLKEVFSLNMVEEKKKFEWSYFVENLITHFKS